MRGYTAEKSYRIRVGNPEVLKGVQGRGEDMAGEAEEKDTEGAVRGRVQAPASLKWM
jgi:hypothetical protein